MKTAFESESVNATCEMIVHKQELEMKALLAANKALEEFNNLAFLRFAPEETVEQIAVVVTAVAALLKELRMRKN